MTTSPDPRDVEAVALVIAEREWDMDAAGYGRWVAEVDAGAKHDGDCTKQCHSCVVCTVARIRESATAAILALDRSRSERQKE